MFSIGDLLTFMLFSVLFMNEVDSSQNTRTYFLVIESAGEFPAIQRIESNWGRSFVLRPE